MLARDGMLPYLEIIAVAKHLHHGGHHVRQTSRPAEYHDASFDSLDGKEHEDEQENPNGLSKYWMDQTFKVG